LTKQITVTFKAVYKLEGALLEEYLEQLHGHEDTLSQRQWFVIDRFVGHDNLRLFDLDARMSIDEEEI
jgi:hypothetical protein